MISSSPIFGWGSHTLMSKVILQYSTKKANRLMGTSPKKKTDWKHGGIFFVLCLWTFWLSWLILLTIKSVSVSSLHRNNDPFTPRWEEPVGLFIHFGQLSMKVSRWKCHGGRRVLSFRIAGSEKAKHESNIKCIVHIWCIIQKTIQIVHQILLTYFLKPFNFF